MSPKKLYLFIISLLVIINTYAQPWHRTYVTPIPSNEVLCYDYNQTYGGVICMNTNDDSVRYASDYYIVKINTSGDVIWQLRNGIDYSGRVVPIAMAQLTNGDYLIGGTTKVWPFNNDHLVFARLDSNGNIIHRIVKPGNGGTTQFDLNVMRANDKGYYISYLSGVTTLTEYLDKYDSSDNLVWSKAFPNYTLTTGRTADNGVAYITSTNMGKYDENGVLLYDNYIGPVNVTGSWYIQGTSDNNFIAFVWDTAITRLIKVNPTGHIIHQILLDHNFYFHFTTETSRGDYIMFGLNIYGYYRYDTGFNIIDSSVNPFNDSAYLITRIIPNNIGGGFCSYVRDSSGTSQIFAVNFDSLFNIHKDLQISLGSHCLVPGYVSHLHADLHNNGSVLVDTTFKVILDSNCTFVSSSIAPIATYGDTLVYKIDSLQPGCMDSIIIDIVVDSSIGMGSLLTFYAFSSYANNLGITDDSTVFCGTTVSSLDPNIKEVNRPYYFTRDKPLVYTIGYENTGNSPARNITLIDTLDSHLDLLSFKALNNSTDKASITWLADNVIKVFYANINLPDSMNNPDGSHGEFVFSINTREDANMGDSIFNTAYITFDFNNPIKTNTTTNIISLENAPIDTIPLSRVYNQVSIYPNPFSKQIFIGFPDTSTQWKVQILDVLGNKVFETIYKGNELEIEPTLPNGVYLLKVINLRNNNTITNKIIRKS